MTFMPSLFHGPGCCPECDHPIKNHKFGGKCTDCPEGSRFCMQPVKSGKPYRLPKEVKHG